MSEYPLPVKSLWQPPLGWLGVTLLAGLCLWFFYQQAPPTHQRSLRTARWLVIPYLGLLTGGISPRLMGLTGINWFASFGFGLVLIGSVLVTLVLVRSVMAISGSPTTLVASSFASLPANRLQPMPLLKETERQQRYTRAIANAVFNLGVEEFHLAFVRSAIWELLWTTASPTLQAGYWAAWAALAITIPEALSHQSTLTQRLSKGALLVATTVLFIFTRNFWLSWLLHLLGWLVLAPSTVQRHPTNRPVR